MKAWTSAYIDVTCTARRFARLLEFKPSASVGWIGGTAMYEKELGRLRGELEMTLAIYRAEGRRKEEYGND